MEKGILIKDTAKLVDGRSSESNWRKERDMEDDIMGNNRMQHNNNFTY